MVDDAGIIRKLNRAGQALIALGVLTIAGGFVVATQPIGATVTPAPAADAVADEGDANAFSLYVGDGQPPQAPLAAPVAPSPTPEPTVQPAATPIPPTPAPTAVPAIPPVARSATTVPPPPAPPAAPAVVLSSMEQDVFNMHNSERAKAGLAALRLDATLTDIARVRAQDMASKNYFAHTSPSGQTAFSLMGTYGYTFSSAGENIGRNNYPDSQTTSVLMTAFMNSTDHRENILDRHYTNVGAGVAFAPDGMKYFAVLFSSR